jgi:hypothetical protein
VRRSGITVVGASTATTGEGSTKAKKTMVVTAAARKDVQAAVAMQRLHGESSPAGLWVVLGDTGRSQAQHVGGEQFHS